MHIYDPNGSLKDYQRERDRSESFKTLLFAIGTVCLLLFAYAGIMVALSMGER